MIGWIPFNPSSDIASVRLRCLQPIKYLNELGVSCEIFNINNKDSYSKIIFMKAYSCENIKIAREMKEKGKKIIFDICDNHFDINTDHYDYKNKVERLKEMLALADKITVPTKELGISMNISKFHVIPDALELINHQSTFNIYKLGYSIKNFKLALTKKPKTINLIWYGNAGNKDPSSGLYDLKKIEGELVEVSKILPIRLNITSNNKDIYNELFVKSKVETKYFDWSLKKFPKIMSAMDLTLIPITVSNITNGKSPNRVITSLLYGVPVIADLIPSYKQFENDIMEGNWSENIQLYSKNIAVHTKKTEAARERILDQYSLKTISQSWIEALNG